MRGLFILTLFSATALFGQCDIMPITIDTVDPQVSGPDPAAVGPPPKIRYLHIESTIAYRFATTKVASMLANSDDKPREAVFNLQLPKSAFITKFSMTIEGVTYDGTVKEKEAARREYIEAKRQGQSAGHIVAKPRNTNAFDVSVNVAAGQKVTFNLTYEELLQRALAMYQDVIYINPGQIVDDLRVDVYINESRPINSLKVPALQKDIQDTLDTTEVNPHATIQKTSPNSAHISYYPSADLQKEMSEIGISGQFVVQYDVQRGYDAGDIQVVDGYFVHFIAPSGLPAVKKNVLFILDISGSMSGKKLQQVKGAMEVILPDLQPDDLFNIFLFDDRIRKWNATHMEAVNAVSLRKAKEYVRNMAATGSTDINLALTEGISFLKNQRTQEKPMNPSSIIVFLTDGDPTSGVTNIDQILTNVRTANDQSGYSIFSLGFGRGVDFTFLRKISLQNNALARKIYEDSDAALQLQDFYKEISTPLLTDLKVEYLDVVTENTTRVEFPNYFNGSEIMICGTFGPPEIDVDGELMFRTKVIGRSNGNDVIIEKSVDVLGSSNSGLRVSTERLWAYLTIKELLEKMETTTNETIMAEIKKRALSLSLKYSFVTPLTSMIVTKPGQNATRSDLSDNDDPSSSDRGRAAYQPSGLSGVGGLSGRVNSPQRGKAGPNVPYSSPNSGVYTSFVDDPMPVGLSSGKGSSPPQTPSALINPGDSVMLHGLDGPRVVVNTSSALLCHDPPVWDGERLVMKLRDRSGVQIYATFSLIDGMEIMTGVKVVIPKCNLTMEADLTKLDILCHGVPETRTWQDLIGTTQDLMTPSGHPMPGMQHGGSSSMAWATMNPNYLKIHVSRNVCLYLSHSYNDVHLTNFLNLKFEVVRPPPARATHMMGKYFNAKLKANNDLEVPNKGALPTLLPFSNPVTDLEFINPFTDEEEICVFI